MANNFDRASFERLATVHSLSTERTSAYGIYCDRGVQFAYELMTAVTLASSSGITEEQAKETIRDYFKRDSTLDNGITARGIINALRSAGMVFANRED